MSGARARAAARRAALAGLALAALARVGWAAFEDLGAGARAPGMGNAFVAVADDVYAVHYNPAGLGLLERPQLGTSYTRHHLGLTDRSSLSTSLLAYAQPLAEGRRGTLATAWSQFSLGGAYTEQTLALSYGRLWLKREGGGELYGGVTAKYLHSAVGSLSEEGNAYAGILRTGQADPVLGRSHGKGVFDADAGLLWRFAKHYSLGAAATHVPQPNVAFSPSDSDRLPMGLKAGLDYRSLVSNLVVQVDTRRSPAGGRDNLLTVAAERWFPRLFVGEFGLRGALGLGTREYKQVDLGLSYRTRRLGIDYAFAMPINTVVATAGSHRVAFNIRFGRASDEEESLEMILEAMRQIKTGRPAAAPAPEAKGLSVEGRAFLEEYLAQAKALQLSARYKDAADRLTAALGVAPADKGLVVWFGRLNYVAQQIRALPEYRSDPMQAVLHQGLLAYIEGRDAEAVQKVSQALALKPDYRELEVFLAQLESQTGYKRLPVPPKPRRYALASKLTRADAAIQDGKYREAIELSREVLREDEGEAAAWQNLGTAHFALREYEKSLQAWRRAYSLEKSPALRTAIKGYIRSVERAIARRSKTTPVRSPVPEAPPPAQRPSLSTGEIQRLFDQGIDHYTRREFDKAKTVFETILQADPENEEALKALRRVKDEIR